MDKVGFFFVENALNRCNISARQLLKPNADGAAARHIHNENPGNDKDSSWSPCAIGQISLMMRLYRPSENNPSTFDTPLTIPPVKIADQPFSMANPAGHILHRVRPVG